MNTSATPAIRRMADWSEEKRCEVRGRLDRRALNKIGKCLFGPPPYHDLRHSIERDECVDAYWKGRKEPRP